MRAIVGAAAPAAAFRGATGGREADVRCMREMARRHASNLLWVRQARV